MTTLLVLRPQPGADETARAAARLGLAAMTAPLFAIVPLAWAVPAPAGFDALMLTSAAAARQAGTGLARLTGLRVYAVGAATAAAARAAGFADVRVGEADAAALLARAAEDGVRALLHLAGADHRDATHPAITIDRRIVYRASAVARLPDDARAALAQGAVALLHSPRAAALFAVLSGDRGATRIAALSPAAAAAAGAGWAAVAVAPAPTDAALLAAAARLCDQIG